MKIKIITFVIELGIKSIVAPCDEVDVSVSSKPDPPLPGDPRGFAHSSCLWGRVFAPLSFRVGGGGGGA